MTRIRFVSVASLIFAAIASVQADDVPKSKPSPQYFVGKVVPLAPLLEKSGIKLDADAAAQSMALVRDDGTFLVLVKNDGSRMFFKDKRLLDRPMRLTGRIVAGQMLHVSDVHSIVKGKLHDIYYWCEKCQLRFTEAGKCICCGSETVLTEEPLN